ncbi:MAG: helix-turn-helix domain-containing protein [Dehalococcoidia bacterium]
MSLANKPLDEITEDDLQQLRVDQVPESKTIDYKEFQIEDTRDAKTEFLADVSSFANASGGHLILGIKEDEGIPVEISGLQIDPDKEKLRLENLIRDGIEPRLPGVTIHAVSLSTSNYALVIHVPRSWAMPHRVIFNRHAHFYSRHSAGKYKLDVPELRAAFTQSDTVYERIRNFRAERLSMIVADEAPLPLGGGTGLALHVIPFNAFDPSIRHDLAPLMASAGILRPMGGGGSTPIYNLDGILSYGASTNSYLQVFRTGCIEAVDSNFLQENQRGVSIPSVAFEFQLLQAMTTSLEIQRLLGAEPPFAVMVSMLGVRGLPLNVVDVRIPGRGRPINRDALILNEVIVETFDVEPAQALHPIFDTVWNAAGYAGSFNYSPEGVWGEGLNSPG